LKRGYHSSLPEFPCGLGQFQARLTAAGYRRAFFGAYPYRGLSGILHTGSSRFVTRSYRVPNQGLLRMLSGFEPGGCGRSVGVWTVVRIV